MLAMLELDRLLVGNYTKSKTLMPITAEHPATVETVSTLEHDKEFRAFATKMLSETYTILASYHINDALLKKYWHPNLKYWGHTHKITLVYLITGQISDEDAADKGIQPLAEDKRLAPMAALQKMSGLNSGELIQLMKNLSAPMPHSQPDAQKKLTNRLIGTTPVTEEAGTEQDVTAAYTA